MQALRGLAFLLLLQAAGEALAHGFGWPVPGPVIGLMLLLPALQWAGFDATATAQPDSALQALTWLYAGLPLLLKTAAVVLLMRWRSAG